MQSQKACGQDSKIQGHEPPRFTQCTYPKIWSINNGACDMFHWFFHLLKHALTLMFKYMPAIGCKEQLMQPSFSNKQKKKDYVINSKIITSIITFFMCSHV
jgi:hypothetical protein